MLTQQQTLGSHKLGLVSVPSLQHAVEDKTQDEDGQTGAQQRLLYHLQHRNAGEELPLKHVCRFVIQRSRLVTETEKESLIIMHPRLANYTLHRCRVPIILPHSSKQGGIWCNP